jgi:alpha-L-arabinofuranosidase
VRQWWKGKVKEIYALIPDFGGFLVKANSEGQSGPQDYGRTHADGANMLADALKPYKGIVMWRAFVYNPTKEDRAKQAYQEFVPLDGQFRDNVIIQIKNGPVDFQPREPVSPLFGALNRTQEMIEFQITQEYLGHSKQLVYLAPLFEETLQADTYAGGEGSTVARITDGSLRPAKVTAIAGVANTGDNTNWCGHIFAQSNWYAYGRLAWNNRLGSEQIAGEWIRLTFTSDPNFITPVKDMMMTSHEACVNYMMPYGLHHIFSFNEHYGPGPWDDAPNGRPDWMPWYYHNADTAGVGFDRTATGSNAVSQYFPPKDEIYADLARCPENLLLWFHHVPWTYKMKNGLSLWDNLCYRYDAGVKKVGQYQSLWDRMKPYIDEQRFFEVQSKLKIHLQDAIIWKDACLLYFQTFSRIPIPNGVETPAYALEELKMREFMPVFSGVDSVFITAFTSGNDGRSGLQFAWSTDRKRSIPIGNRHAFLRSDYGAWGGEKRLYNPTLFRDTEGVWHCVFDLNPEGDIKGYTSSKDLILWKPQNYFTADEMTVHIKKIPVAEKNGDNTYKVPVETVEMLENNYYKTLYRHRLYGETTAQDTVRFAGLNDINHTLSIRFDKKKKISNKLIGVFFEDINYAADGGLYAELIRNRDFEYSSKDRREWDYSHAWHFNGQNDGMNIDTVKPLHPNNPHYIVLNAGDKLLNEGWDGIPVQAGKRYDLSVFARAPRNGMITAKLVDNDGIKISAEISIPVNSASWKKYTAVLTARQTAGRAHLLIETHLPAPLHLDMISLFPQKTFRNRKNGLRADLAQTIADLKPRFVRFPGGCVAHGNGIDNIYQWKHSIGKLEERKPDRNLWGYHQTKGLGYYEYFLFCEDIGAEPLPVLAAGVPCQNSDRHNHELAGQQGGIPIDEMDEYIQDILDLIAWANGDAKTDKWAKKRAEAGHPKPFNLKYIGIGNEDLISDVFKERFEMIYRAIKEKHPEITVIGTVGPFSEGSDYTFGWEFATQLGVPMVDEHYYQPPGWFIHNQDYYDRYDRNRPKVYLGEYAAHLPGRPNNIETALAEALHLCNVERNGDIVTLTSYAPLLAKEGRTQWNPDLIYFNGTEVKPTVGYQVQKLFGNHSGDEYIEATADVSDKREDVRLRIASSVVRDSETGDVVIKLVNLLPVNVKSGINFDGFDPTHAEAFKTVLQGKPDDKTALPQTSTFSMSKQSAVDLPAYSFTVIRIATE